MNTPRCLKIADRMHVLLIHELGEGIDRQRMVQEPLYARDVLLVCDALVGSDLASLAQHFRSAAAQADPETPETTPGALAGASRFLSSLFGPPSTLDSAQQPGKSRFGRKGPSKE